MNMIDSSFFSDWEYICGGLKITQENNIKIKNILLKIKEKK